MVEGGGGGRQGSRPMQQQVRRVLAFGLDQGWANLTGGATMGCKTGQNSEQQRMDGVLTGEPPHRRAKCVMGYVDNTLLAYCILKSLTGSIWPSGRRLPMPESNPPPRGRSQPLYLQADGWNVD